MEPLVQPAANRASTVAAATAAARRRFNGEVVTTVLLGLVAKSTVQGDSVTRRLSESQRWTLTA